MTNDEARMTKREVRHENRRMSAEQRTRYAKLARAVEQEFPPGKAVASRDPELPASLGDYFDLRSLVGELRRAREAQDITLAELARITGIDRAALSRIESGENLNPTVNTLARYAQAVGRRVRFSLEIIARRKANLHGSSVRNPGT